MLFFLRMIPTVSTNNQKNWQQSLEESAMSSQSPPRKRPTPVTVIAILNIVFGAIFTLIYICGGIVTLVVVNLAYSPTPHPDKQARLLLGILKETLIEAPVRHIPYYPQVQLGTIIFDVVMTFIILIAGIALLRMRSWARIACIGYAVLSILVRIGTLIYALAVVVPAQDKIQADVNDWLASNLPPGAQIPPDAGSNPVLEGVGPVFGFSCGLIYPVVVLIIMLLPSVTAAFRKWDQEPLPGSSDLEDDYFGFERPRGKEDF
jgi:hypothetical protein